MIRIDVLVQSLPKTYLDSLLLFVIFFLIEQRIYGFGACLLAGIVCMLLVWRSLLNCSIFSTYRYEWGLILTTFTLINFHRSRWLFLRNPSNSRYYLPLAMCWQLGGTLWLMHYFNVVCFGFLGGIIPFWSWHGWKEDSLSRIMVAKFKIIQLN